MDKTLGQIRVRIDYGITKADDVLLIKQQTAHLNDMLEDKRLEGSIPAVSEKQRLISIAQSKYEEACMFAVKALTINTSDAGESDLVSFGNYLLSDKRENMLKEKCTDDIEERRKYVHSADLENWTFQNTDK